MAYFECLSVIVTIQFATNDFSPYVLSSNIMSQIIKRKFILLCLHIKIHVPFWDELKKA
jgi:hypothetical protein